MKVDQEFDDKFDAALSRAKKRAARRETQIANLINDISKDVPLTMSPPLPVRRDSMTAARAKGAEEVMPKPDISQQNSEEDPLPQLPPRPLGVAHDGADTVELQQGLFVDRVDAQAPSLFRYILRNLTEQEVKVTVSLEGSDNVMWDRAGDIHETCQMACAPRSEVGIGEAMIADTKASWSLVVEYDWQMTTQNVAVASSETKSTELDAGLFVDRLVITAGAATTWEFVVRNETEHIYTVSVSLGESENITWTTGVADESQSLVRSALCDPGCSESIGVAAAMDAKRAWSLSKQYNWKRLLIPAGEAGKALAGQPSPRVVQFGNAAAASGRGNSTQAQSVPESPSAGDYTFDRASRKSGATLGFGLSGRMDNPFGPTSRARPNPKISKEDDVWKDAAHDDDFVEIGRNGVLRVRSVVRTNPLMQMDKHGKL